MGAGREYGGAVITTHVMKYVDCHELQRELFPDGEHGSVIELVAERYGEEWCRQDSYHSWGLEFNKWEEEPSEEVVYFNNLLKARVLTGELQPIANCINIHIWW